MEKDLKDLTSNLNINYNLFKRNRIIETVIMLFISITLFLINDIFFICIFLLPYLVYKGKYNNLVKNKNNLIKMNQKLFPFFIKDLLILLKTNNVYNSLKEELNFIGEPYKTYITNLLNEMDSDKSKKPFDNFAAKLGFNEANLVMNTLYTFQEYSISKEHLENLDLLVEQLYNNMINQAIEEKKRYNFLYSNALILTCLLFTFSFGVYMFLNILNEVSI